MTSWILMRSRKRLSIWLLWEQSLLLSVSSSSGTDHSELDKHSSSSSKSLYTDCSFTTKKFSTQQLCPISGIPETQSQLTHSSLVQAVVQWSRVCYRSLSRLRRFSCAPTHPNWPVYSFSARWCKLKQSWNKHNCIVHLSTDSWKNAKDLTTSHHMVTVVK